MCDEIYKQSFELFLSHTNEKEVVKKILERRIDLKSVNSFLDIGGGNGSFAHILGKQIKNVLIIEPNKKFNKDLRKRGFRCICSKWEDVHLEEKFDLILAAYVVTYFPSNMTSSLINKMIRCLNKNGKLVLLAVDEKEGSWRETHSYFYDLINLKRKSTTAKLKKIMTLLDARQEKFTTKIYADNVNQMLEIITFDFYKYGDRFKNNKGNLI
jgi:cyclopropane fatty-acyl-phospholipid synthase-like methyltransferase